MTAVDPIPDDLRQAHDTIICCDQVLGVRFSISCS